MANREIVAIGASAGGVEALLFLAKSFPREFPAAVIITLHLSSQFRSSLDELLGRAGPLPAKFVRDGDVLKRSRIYLAPSGHHLLVDGDRLKLGHGPRENNVRPSIDPMLRSIGLCCGGRAIGVVLTGTMSDGASGLWAVSQCGGLSVVQDPSDAAFPDMPINALNRTEVDYVVKLSAIPALLTKLAHEPAGPSRTPPPSLAYEIAVAKGVGHNMSELDRIGKRSVLACPDCHGVMWEIDEGRLVRYRCHVGHTYAAELMSVALDENLHRAMGSALRALEERLALAQKLLSQAEKNNHPQLASTWANKAQEVQRELDILRGSLARLDAFAAETEMKRVS